MEIPIVLDSADYSVVLGREYQKEIVGFPPGRRKLAEMGREVKNKFRFENV